MYNRSERGLYVNIQLYACVLYFRKDLKGTHHVKELLSNLTLGYIVFVQIINSGRLNCFIFDLLGYPAGC